MHEVQHETPWVNVPVPRPDARLRLYCFPYAGSGAGVYRPWAGQLDDRLEVRAVALPGRERRFVEPALPSVDALADLLVPALRSTLVPPFAIFGHSLGAMLGFEVSRRLAASGHPPVHLLVSAARAPHESGSGPNYHLLNDVEFKSGVRDLGGTPPELLEHDEFLDMMLPTLRADFTAAETFRFAPGQPLPCPITAFCGDADPMVTPAEMEHWAVHTTGAFRVHTLPGDHFFLATAQRELLTLIAAELSR